MTLLGFRCGHQMHEFGDNFDYGAMQHQGKQISKRGRMQIRTDNDDQALSWLTLINSVGFAQHQSKNLCVMPP